MIYTGWEDRRDLSHWTHLLSGQATIFPLPTAFPHLFPLYLKDDLFMINCECNFMTIEGWRGPYG